MPFVAAGIPAVTIGGGPPLSGRRDRTDQDPRDVAVIFATSGTTGAPKAVPPHGNLYDNTGGPCHR